MDQRLLDAANKTTALSVGTNTPLSRVVLRESDDGLVITMLLAELSGYGLLMRDPSLKDRLMEMWFLALRTVNYPLPQQPRFSFRFSVDL